MYNIDLCHFGNNCAPGIIIDELLNIKKKTLFMLAIYHFNDILYYLNDNNYENIYNRELLYIQKKNFVKHKTYNFVFSHDYICDNNEISNYDLIKERFDIKISNFKNMLQSEDMTIFINFTLFLHNLKIQDMLKWLENNKKTFHLIIFTNNEYDINNYNYNNLSIIKLDLTFNEWWLMELQCKMDLYKEIYEKFIKCLLEKK
jgi:hypothetical protein